MAKLKIVAAIFAGVFFAIARATINYLDNDLAKVCRPVDQPLDLLFVLDGSGSVESSTFDTQLQMLNNVVDMVDIGEDKTKIAVLQYASYTYVEFLFKTFKDKASVREAIKSISHKLGTTKTGKALDKATQLFNDPTTGSRRGHSSGKQQNIAQVAIVVSDGHSHDNPIPAALRLRESGAHLIALGIGPHINKDELLQMTGDPELVFENLTQSQSAAHFAETLRMRFAISEACEYSRGAANDGADVRCEKDGVHVSVTTRAPFGGHFYVQEHFHSSNCKWDSSMGRPSHSEALLTNNSAANSATKTPTNISNEGGDELSLLIPFNGCGVQRQFSMNPKGILFQTNVVLQFHPTYNTAVDKNFKIHCFYQDKNREQDSEIDWQLIKEHTQRKSKKNKKLLPCTMRIVSVDENLATNLAANASASSQSTNKCQTSNSESSNFYVGERIILKWECNPDNFDIYQSMLVHNCYLIDPITQQKELILDHNGCSMIERIVKTPHYPSSLTAVSKAFAFRKADSPLARIQCSLRFCDRLMSECDDILPPKCQKTEDKSSEDAENESEKHFERQKRQAGIPVSIRPLNDNKYVVVDETNQITGPPPLVTFYRNKLEKTKNLFKRMRGQSQRVIAIANTRVRNISPTDIRLSTQDVKIIDASQPLTDSLSHSDAITTTKIIPNLADKNQHEPNDIKTTDLLNEKEEKDEDDDDLPPQIAKTLKQHGINLKESSDVRNRSLLEDPFQEIQRIVETEKNQRLIVTDLSANLLEMASLNNIIVQTQIINVQDKILSQNSDKCLPKK